MSKPINDFHISISIIVFNFYNQSLMTMQTPSEEKPNRTAY